MKTHQNHSEEIKDIAIFGMLTSAMACIAITGNAVIDWILHIFGI
jgi:hypothetical protein